MPISEYDKAYKLAEKCYKSQLQKGNSPYLLVLDELLKNVETESEVSLGLVEVPLDLIVGTKTAGRTTAFASNFMPLLDEDTEFAAKWKTLFSSLEEEGLNSPIKAYEYLNQFYVLEGNKRVSCMKYLDSFSIPATVTRIIPKFSNDPQIRLYYEFMDFYSQTKINFLIFSELGSYGRFLKMVHSSEECWSEELRRDVKAIYYRFLKAYKLHGGEKLQITAGDAFLSCLTIYGYDQLLAMTSDQIEKAVSKSWKEYAVLEDDQAINLQMQPSDEKPSLLKKILPEAKLRIAFVHDKNAKSSTWTYGHELGRAHLEHVFNDRVETTCFDNVSIDHGCEVLEEVISDGFDLIFTTTPRLMNASLQMAAKYPNKKILNCSLYTSHPLLRTYYCRMYEAKFLMGMIAGAMTEDNRIGYLADYPINGMIACINAFALGAKMVNPYAKIILRWTSIQNSDGEAELYAQGINYISGRDWIMPQEQQRHFGLYRVTDESANLAAPLWDWGCMYERIVRRVLNGNWNNEDAVREQRALNYYWGMSAGVIDILYSKSLPSGLIRLIEVIKTQIINGSFQPLSGQLMDQNHIIRQKKDQSLSPDEMIRMDWLVENIEGTIPDIGQLKEDARALVEVLGLETKAE